MYLPEAKKTIAVVVASSSRSQMDHANNDDQIFMANNIGATNSENVLSRTRSLLKSNGDREEEEEMGRDGEGECDEKWTRPQVNVVRTEEQRLSTTRS